MTDDPREPAQLVGPVLTAGDVASVVVAAIRELNRDVIVRDHGAYLRVLVPHRCVVTRQAIEHELQQRFRLPGDLEQIMPSFQGMLSVNSEQAVWSSEAP
jgi:toluene monooxygenase system protein D